MYVASRIEGAPRWLAHFAGVLAAEGGNIRTGLVWLKAMFASNKDEAERQRYEKEIKAFEQGLLVQTALEQYIHKLGRSPETLDDLVPDYIGQLPDFEHVYRLEYKRPNLSLKRGRL